MKTKLRQWREGDQLMERMRYGEITLEGTSVELTEPEFFAEFKRVIENHFTVLTWRTDKHGERFFELQMPGDQTQEWGMKYPTNPKLRTAAVLAAAIEPIKHDVERVRQHTGRGAPS